MHKVLAKHGADTGEQACLLNGVVFLSDGRTTLIPRISVELNWSQRGVYSSVTFSNLLPHKDLRHPSKEAQTRRLGLARIMRFMT
jgi:hypothetical protein